MKSELLRLGSAWLVLVSFCATAQAPGDLRVALVIGNSAYTGPAMLENPANDAKAISGALRRLGFQVLELRDGNKAQMNAALAEASEKLKGRQGIGMLFYAGHGLQLDWNNYMVPVDAKLTQASDVEVQTLNVNSVVKVFTAAGNRMNIIVLDACRDNPFTGYASAKGLAPVDAPAGTFLAYSTAPGNVADDGDTQSGNGLYTQYLVQELQRPAARIEDVFKRVRLQVRQKSNGRQIPWESTSLEEDFSFSEAKSARPEDLERMAEDARRREQELRGQAAKAREREGQIAQDLERERRIAQEGERERQASVKKEQQDEAQAQAREREARLVLAQQQERELAARLEKERVEAAARRRAQAVVVALADSRVQVSPSVHRDPVYVEQRAAWEKIRQSADVNDFYAYLIKYPSGVFAEQAQFEIERLARTAISAQQGPDGLQSVAAVVGRYRVGDRFIYTHRDLYGREFEEKLEVSSVTDAQVKLNGGRITADLLGNVAKSTRPSQVNVPVMKVPTELRVGKRWEDAFDYVHSNGTLITIAYTFKAVALEKISIKAGEFLAFRIESVGWHGTPWPADPWQGPTRLTGTYWVDARSFTLLKETWRRGQTDRATAPDGFSRELVSATRAPA